MQSDVNSAATSVPRRTVRISIISQQIPVANRKRRRFGHLFQGRFKAVLVDADEYLTPVPIYPCRDYAWSSYRALSGYVESPEMLETDRLLSLFEKDRDTAKKLETDRRLKRREDRIRRKILNI